MEENEEAYFTLVHQNIQSIRNKCNDLLIFIDNLKMPVNAIALTEHWLRPYETIGLDGFEMASCFVRTTGLHGGSCILVPTGTEYVELKTLKEKSEEKTGD